MYLRYYYETKQGNEMFVLINKPPDRIQQKKWAKERWGVGCGVEQIQQQALGQGSLETHPNYWQFKYRGKVCSRYEKVWEILLALRIFWFNCVGNIEQSHLWSQYDQLKS